MPSFHLSYADVRAARVTLAAGAVAGLVVIAACREGPSRTITAPPAVRAAVIASGNFGQARLLMLCVDASSPNTNYTVVTDQLNRNFALGGFDNTLDGNGAFIAGFWNDPGDGGTGTATANALEGVPYTVAAGGCVRC